MKRKIRKSSLNFILCQDNCRKSDFAGQTKAGLERVILNKDLRKISSCDYSMLKTDRRTLQHLK